MEKENENEKKKGGWKQWPQKLCLKYFLYLVAHYKTLLKEKEKESKISKFFKNMANWLNGQKKSSQCRTHHIKCLEKYQTNKKIIFSLIKGYYLNRIFPISHLEMEMNHHLLYLLNQKAISDKQMNGYLSQTRQFIKDYPLLFKEMQNQGENEQTSSRNDQQDGSSVSSQVADNIFYEEIMAQQVQGQEYQHMNSLYRQGDIDPDSFIS